MLAISSPIHGLQHNDLIRVVRGQLDLALSTADAGVPVHPVGHDRKTPLTAHGFNDATTDPAQINRWWQRSPNALVSIPTGETTGIVVLDIDRGGEESFAALLARLGCELPEDLSDVWAYTPNNGRHYFFKHKTGTAPRTRASDIAPNIDNRGIGGSIIIPGNVLPDGRVYRWGGAGRFPDLQHLPRELLYLMTFSVRERRWIDATPSLKTAVSDSTPERWASILAGWRDREAVLKVATAPDDIDDDGMRRQALHDLHAIAVEFAGLSDGRRQKLFSLACRVARYVHHGFLSDIEFRGTLMDAARANGSLAKHGAPWAVSTIRNAINRASRDPLPPLARAFRTEWGT